MTKLDKRTLQGLYDNHTARQILLRFRQLDASLYILNENYNKLKQFINIYKISDSKKVEIISPENQDNYTKYLLEITRLFHNYVASVYSLIDHTRRYYNKFYKANGLFLDYENKMTTTFKNNSLAIFIKDLRQYCQHYSIPNIFLDCLINPDESLEIYLKLEIKSLLKYDGWNHLSLKFINGHDLNKDIDLENIIDTYNDLVLKFQKWFRYREFEINKNDLENFEKIKCELFYND